jgi:hypothetical protein
VALHVVASKLISAPPDRVSELYQDYTRWAELFPATIRGTRLLEVQGATRRIAVDHATAGQVVNVMTIVSPREIRLDEVKPRYDARFVNLFDPDPRGTRYTVVADIELRGLLRKLTAFARPLVRHQIARFILRPLKAMAERR